MQNINNIGQRIKLQLGNSLFLFCSIFIFLSWESDGGAIFWTNSHPLRSLLTA